MIYMLARATGWGEETILNMPFVKFLQYLHCHLVYQGAATRWLTPTAQELAETDAKFESFFPCH